MGGESNLAVVTPVWAENAGDHYEGIVKSDEVDRILELYKRPCYT